MSPAYRSLNLVIMGPPASGKEALAGLLGQRYEIPHIATGAMLRSEVERATTLGQQVQRSVERRELVEDHLVRGLIQQRLVREDCARGFLLNGYPRTLAQVGMLDDILAELGRAIERVILLRLPDDVVLERMREDADRQERPKESTRQRLRQYHDMTTPVEKLYRRRGLLVEVDGNRPAEQVTAAMLEAVGTPVGA